MPRTLSDYAREWADSDEATFCAKLDCPVLVESGMHKMPATPDAQASSKREGYYTNEVDVADVMSRFVAVDKRQVLPVQKRSGPFADHISVGRTTNLDICLSFTGVSKFHAHFSRRADGVYLLTDRDSTNGTFVDGSAIKPNTSVAVPDNAEVRFATYCYRFMLPQRFFRLLQTLGLGQKNAR